MNKTIYLLIMTASLALALGYWYGPNPPKSAHHLLTRKEAFGALPSQPEWKVDEAYQTLVRTDPWHIQQPDGQSQNSTGPLRQIRFYGVLTEGRQRMALIEVDGKVRSYRVGDRLPNDARIVEITDMVLTVDHDGRRHHYRLYQG